MKDLNLEPAGSSGDELGQKVSVFLLVATNRDGFIGRDDVGGSGDNDVEFLAALSHGMDDEGRSLAHSCVIKSFATSCDFPTKGCNYKIQFREMYRKVPVELYYLPGLRTLVSIGFEVMGNPLYLMSSL